MRKQVEGTHRHKTDGEVYSHRVSYTVYADESRHGAIALLGFICRAGRERSVSTQVHDPGLDHEHRAPTIVCQAVDAHIDGIDFTAA